MMCLQLNCAAVPEQRVELRQECRINVRLMAERSNGRKKRFEPDEVDEAWKFAGPDGEVLKWSKTAGMYVPTNWPCHFMVFRPGGRGRGNKRFMGFGWTLEWAKECAKDHDAAVFERPENPLAKLVNGLFP